MGSLLPSFLLNYGLAAKLEHGCITPLQSCVYYVVNCCCIS